MSKEDLNWHNALYVARYIVANMTEVSLPTISSIARGVGITRQAVYRCYDSALIVLSKLDK